MAGFNHSHEEVAFDSQRNVDLRILPLGRLMPHSQKFMNDTLQNKVNMMEGRIVGFIDRLRKTTGVEATENVAIPVQEPTWVAGQICCDSDEGRLNPTSIELMGSLLYSEGSVAKLDVSRLQNYRLYPGQVVAVQGVNPTGETFVAMDLITKCPKPMHSTASQQLQLSVPTPAKFRLLVASGPFTTMGDLRYGPLKKLGELCRQEKFDAALLIGPFVDVDHPMLSKGSIDISFEELFQSEVVPILEDMKSAGTAVLTMPSTRDAHHFPVYPTPPFQLKGPLHCQLSSPCCFAVGDVAVAACSQDIVKHISMAATEHCPNGLERMRALWELVIGQASFCPVLPPPLGSFMDSSLCSYLEFPCTPNILVLPSDLCAFGKAVHVEMGARESVSENQPDSCVDSGVDVVCLNPGRAAKGRQGGTYAVLSFPIRTRELKDFASTLVGACQVNVKRI